MGIVYKLMNHNRRPEMLGDGDNRPEPLQDTKITADHILQLCKFLAEKSQRNKKSSLGRRKQHTKTHQNVEYTSELHLALEQDVNREGEIRKDTETEPHREAVATEAMRTKETTTTAALPLIKHNRLFVDASLAGPPKQVLGSHHHHHHQQQQQQLQHQQCIILPSFSSSAPCSKQHQQGNKKDILQKIRNQILERKRQRQLASVQRLGGVWRPW